MRSIALAPPQGQGSTGGGGGGGTIAILDDVGDVNATGVSNNQALTWDSGTSTWVPEDFVGTGVATSGLALKSGNASTTVFTIAHGLGAIPDFVSVEAASIDALGDFVVTKDATNLTITYQFPPPSGTNNLSFEWGAGESSLSTTASAGVAASGLALKSGNASTTVFTIPHGLAAAPDFVSVDPASVDALGEFAITKDATNITITYQIAPPSGSSNLSYEWGAGNRALTSNSSGINAGGTALKSGDAATTVFTIAHGLGQIPDFVSVSAASTAARGDFIVTKDATNITITYAIAPATGSSNLTFEWGAGFVSLASSVFTPSSTNTVTGKKVGDGLGFVKVATPSDPTVEEAILSLETEDGNNNALYLKIKKAGAIVREKIG